MGSTLRIRRDEKRYLSWMPNSGTFMLLLDVVATKMETKNDADLAQSIKRASRNEHFSYFSLADFNEAQFTHFAEAVIEVFNDTKLALVQRGEEPIHLRGLAELLALLSFDDRCSIEPFPFTGTILINENNKWTGKGWIYSIIIIFLTAIAEQVGYGKSGEIIKTLFKAAPLWDIEASAIPIDMLTTIFTSLRLSYAQGRSIGIADEFDSELYPAARQLCDLFFQIYPPIDDVEDM